MLSMPLRPGTGEFRVRSKVSAQNPAGPAFHSPGTGRRSAAAFRLLAWSNGAATASIMPNQTTTYVSRLGVVQAF